MAGVKDFKASVTFQKELFDQWVDQSRKQVNQQIAEAVGDHVDKVAETAAQLCPVKSGGLRDSIISEHKQGSFYGRVRATAPHAHLVAFGTSRGAQGNNFLYKAGERHESELAAAIKQKVGTE